MLSDRFGRTIDYLRVSVTDRCDLRCSYCIPKGFKDFETPAHWLSFAEIERVVAAFVRLGTRHVRLTGGEPLLRHQLPQLAQRLARLTGLVDLSLSSNGTQLAAQALALRAAGVTRLNISLDSLRRDCMATLTGRDCLPTVLDGLMAAKDAGFSQIKLNMVPVLGVNDGDIDAMISFAMAHGFILRLIEAMPLGLTGQSTPGLNLTQTLNTLQQRFNLAPLEHPLGGGPARYWSSVDGRLILGLITPLSQHFCARCNRVRLSVDGTLYLCLGQTQHMELRPLLRAGCSDAELENAIRVAIELKPEQHDFVSAPSKIMRIMAKTGG